MHSHSRATSRRKVLTNIGTGSVMAVGAGVLAAPVMAQGIKRWTMVTSWAKGSAGPGASADRIAANIKNMSGGKLEVLVRGAGELVSPFGVLDAVADGIAQLGHTASFFWAGKIPSAVFFTTVPFGLTANDHNAWIRHGGGQALWEKAYESFRVLPMMGGNSGMTMAGWSRRKLDSIEDLQGLKIRLAGVGAQVYSRMGAVPQSLPPGEILLALSTGAIDAVEFLGPFSDSAYGFQKAAGHYYFPGFNKPNGTAEGLVGREVFDALDKDLQAIVKTAFDAENDRGLSEAQWFNAQALSRLIADGVNVSSIPSDIVQQAEILTTEVLDEMASGDALMAEILSSYRQAAQQLGRWSQISQGAYQARG